MSCVARLNTDTDVGKMIMAAYYKAFIDLVHHMQAAAPSVQQANAPAPALRVTRQTSLRAGRDPASPVEVTLHPGDMVYPTASTPGGDALEVDTETGARGWMPSADAAPR